MLARAFPSAWCCRTSSTGSSLCMAARSFPVRCDLDVNVFCCRGVALIGYGFSRVTPNHRPFSLTDASISFPYTQDETVRTSILVVVSLIAPAVIIFLVILLFVPASVSRGSGSKLLLLKSKIWEWNAAWLGLGLSVAGVFMATQGLKALYGRPRPDMLARCDPDLSDVASYAIGGLGQRLNDAPTLVTWEICRNKSDNLKVNGFSSFPSGHSSCK